MAKYQYGNRVIDGRTIDIAQVPRKLRKTAEWACTCPLCGDPFIAAMGDNNEDHFRHKNKRLDYECDINHVNQTGVHKRAKEIIQDAQKFHLPAYTVDRREIDFGDLPAYVIESLPEEYTYREDRWIRCDHVELEKRISNIVPDVVAYTPEGEYLIEIYVTNPVTQTKIEKAQKIGLPLLEVDLSDLKYKIISEETLRKAVIDSCDRTEWLYFPDREKALEEARAFYLGHKKVKAYRERQEQLRRQREAAKAAQEEKRRKEKEVTKVESEPEEPVKTKPDLSELSPEEFESVTKSIYETGYDEVKDLDFGKDDQIWDRHGHKWLRCWACGEIKRDGEMVMYQYARGLCRTCHYEKGVKPAWQ